jgi:hypothetical protein
MPGVLGHVGNRRAGLEQQRCEAVRQIMNPNPPQFGFASIWMKTHSPGHRCRLSVTGSLKEAY